MRAPLIGVAATLGKIPPDQLESLDQACFEGYLEGLRLTGYKPDTKQVRLGYTITVLLRYILGANIGELLPDLLKNEENRQRWAEGMRKDTDKVEETNVEVAAYYESISTEALKLLGLGYLARVIFRAARYARLLDKKSRKIVEPAA